MFTISPGQYRPKELLQKITLELKPFVGQSALPEAEIILKVLLNVDSVKIFLNNSGKLTPQKIVKIKKILSGRKKHYPLQYLLGNSDFMGLELRVTPAVFIPRQETEFLVDRCYEILKQKNGSLIGADLGTGCGNIAIALTKLVKNLKMVAMEEYTPALRVARFNAQKHQVADKIKFIRGDFIKIKTSKFDFIISNPPYIPDGQIRKLMPEVRFEPKPALAGGADGLKYIRRILTTAPQYLKNNGFLIIEIGDGQTASIKKILRKIPEFKNCHIFKDYYGKDRVLVCDR